MVDPLPPAPREIALEVDVDGTIGAGDVGRFAFTAPPQGTVAVYLHALGTPGQTVKLTMIHGPLGLRTEVTAQKVEGHRPWGAVRVDMEPGSRVTVDVIGMVGGGAYRFIVHEVDRGPERAAAALPFEGWVEESLDNGYDLDEFHFDGARGDEVVLFHEAPERTEYRLSLFRPGDATAPLWSGTNTVFDRFDPLVLPESGRYRVQMTRQYTVDASDTQNYRLMAYLIDPRPEHASAELRPGSIVEDVLHLRGDRDEYSFDADPAVDYALFLHTHGATPPGWSGLRAVAHDPATGSAFGNAAISVSEVLRDARAPRFRAPHAGPFRVTVSAEHPPLLASGEPGRYRLELFPIDRAPEDVPARIALGQVVQGERIYPFPDVDEFEFEGTAGQIVVVQAEAPQGSAVDLLLPSGDTLTRVWSYRSDPILERHASPRVTLPADGTYRVRVWFDFDETRIPGPGPAGPYRFQVAPLGLGPEIAAAEIQIGDVVANEPLYPVHDVDTFSFTGVAGDTLLLTARQVAYRPNQELLQLIVRRSDTGQAVAYHFARTQVETAQVVLPATGRYEIQVSSTEYGHWPETPFFGLYQIGLRRAP